MLNYIAVIHKDKNSDYGVSFPDFAGCITAGKTIDEAKDMAQEVLQFHIDGMIADGEPLPALSSLDDVVTNEEYSQTVVAYFIVPIKEKKNEVIRFNATMQADLLQDIDEYTKQAGMSRSGFLSVAAEEYLGLKEEGKEYVVKRKKG